MRNFVLNFISAAMKEIKCPNCHTTFSVDDNDYAAILSQVKNQEFDAELDKRIQEISRQYDENAKAAQIIARQEFDIKLADKERELELMSNRLRILDERISTFEALKKTEIDTIKAQNQATVIQFQSDIKELANKHSRLIDEAKHKAQLDIVEREQRINELNARLKGQQTEADMRIREIKEQHQVQLRDKEAEIERLRDFKARLSTKMLGESLEIHCANVFANAQSMGLFPEARFDKDNDIHTGTKGDFIFRDYIDGHEYISIMFEMKNEADSTATKHRNTDFIEKLNKDRTDKHCEYAVLVTMLELNNPVYDNGIVDMSHRYPKMLVIRPQFFLPLLRILTQSAKQNINIISDLRQQLEVAKAETLDVAKFEEKLNRFRSNFDRNVTAAHSKFQSAVTGIDKVIADLEKQIATLRSVKANFESSEQKLLKANQIVDEDFTIKKLTYGNPGMRKRFADAKDAESLSDNGDSE